MKTKYSIYKCRYVVKLKNFRCATKKKGAQPRKCWLCTQTIEMYYYL